MRRCSYCGGPLADSARFCPACGLEMPGYAELFRRRERPRPLGFLDRVPLQGKPAVRMIVAILCCLFLSGQTLQWMMEWETLGLWFLVLDTALALAIVATAWPEREELRPLWRLPRPGWLLLAVAGAMALPALADIYTGLFPESWRSGDDPFENLGPGMKLLSVCLMPGVFEEIAFRGVVLLTLLRMSPTRGAHLLTAALFAGIHFSPLIFPYHFLVGIYLGWLRHRSRGLWAPILAHTVHNAAVVFAFSP